MLQKIIALVNPISGTGKKDAVVAALQLACRKRNITLDVMPTSAQGNYTLVEEKIKTEHTDVVVIIGGDGTVNAVIKALAVTNVVFAIIPLGSGNGLAYAAGIPKKPSAAIDLIFKGKAQWVDAFEVNGQFSCMLSGVGFDATVAHEFAQKSTRGLLTYAQQSIVALFKAQPYQFKVSLPEFEFFTDAYFISVANSNQFGNNFTIAPKASLSDGLLDIVVVQKMSKMKLPFAILRQIRGNNKLQALVDDITTKNVLYFQTPKITIHNLKLAPLHIDGEPVLNSAETVHYTVLPNYFQLIQA